MRALVYMALLGSLSVAAREKTNVLHDEDIQANRVPIGVTREKEYDTENPNSRLDVGATSTSVGFGDPYSSTSNSSYSPSSFNPQGSNGSNGFGGPNGANRAGSNGNSGFANNGGGINGGNGSSGWGNNSGGSSGNSFANGNAAGGANANPNLNGGGGGGASGFQDPNDVMNQAMQQTGQIIGNGGGGWGGGGSGSGPEGRGGDCPPGYHRAPAGPAGTACVLNGIGGPVR